MHFYAVNVCPCCGDVDVDPSVAEDEAGTTERECYQCVFNNSDYGVYAVLECEGDHCAHVTEHQWCERVPF